MLKVRVVDLQMFAVINVTSLFETLSDSEKSSFESFAYKHDFTTTLITGLLGFRHKYCAFVIGAFPHSGSAVKGVCYGVFDIQST
jgi:hypothetical protein